MMETPDGGDDQKWHERFLAALKDDRFFKDWNETRNERAALNREIEKLITKLQALQDRRNKLTQKLEVKKLPVKEENKDLLL